MVSKLKEARENLEDKIKKRTSDLEKTNKFMVGRELKMMELKKEIDSLKNKK
jgi:C4-dicarboxylate-specific signal transduction histidine kinase